MKLVENVHYVVREYHAGQWAVVGGFNGDYLYLVSAADGKATLAYITDPDISREDVKRHFEKIASERKAKARNRKSVAMRRGKA